MADDRIVNWIAPDWRGTYDPMDSSAGLRWTSGSPVNSVNMPIEFFLGLAFTGVQTFKFNVESGTPSEPGGESPVPVPTRYVY